MKIIWNQNKWLREHQAPYMIVGWGAPWPRLESTLERELAEFRAAMDEDLKYFKSLREGNK